MAKLFMLIATNGKNKSQEIKGEKMKVLFALYDKNDNFINCGFSLAEIGIPQGTSWFLQNTIKKHKLYRIPLEEQNDIFKEEDALFINEFEEQCCTYKERAERRGISLRTYFRRLKRSRK